MVYVCDLQDKFAKAIAGFDHVVHATTVLIRGMDAMDSSHKNRRLIMSEQNPDKLGHTVPQVHAAYNDATAFDKVIRSKLRFSMLEPEDYNVSERYFYSGSSNVMAKHHIVCGIEAHVCVLQTVLDLLERDQVVHVCVDAVSSIRLQDRDVALRRMQQAGAYLTTTESILFEMLDSAASSQFRAVSAIVRTPRPEGAPLPSL